MSSEGDIVAFQNSVEDNLPQAETALFNGKRWTYITDSTSNSGNFGSGQIQFDLKSLASQSQWIDLKNAIIEFPVKIVASCSAVTSGVVTGNIHSCIIKNGWHQWVSSAQLMINGQTIQSAQPFENVAAQWKILSSWSQDELVKQGPSCGFSLDDMTGDSEVSALNAGGGLANVLIGNVLDSSKGFDSLNGPTGTVNTFAPNKGALDRASYTNNRIPGDFTTTLQGAVLSSSNQILSGRSNVGTGANTISTAGNVWSAFYMATVRLKDICSIDELPMCKNLNGYLYLNFNSSKITFTNNSNTVTNLTMQVTSGQTTPFLINAAATTGLSGNAINNVITVVGSVDGTATSVVGASGPILTSARLVAPYYLANPKADAMLSQSAKFFTTMDKQYFTFDVLPNKTINYTITSGVSNPKRITMVPMLANLGGAGITQPEQSPFDPAPATSGPFATMSNLQVYVANQPIYQSPIQYDYEQFLAEQATVGLNGNQSNQETSGLLSEQLWTQNHRYYTTDIGRRMDSEDGSSKSVSISYTNINQYTQHVVGHLYSERRWVMDTTTSQVSPL